MAKIIKGRRGLQVTYKGQVMAHSIESMKTARDLLKMIQSQITDGLAMGMDY